MKVIKYILNKKYYVLTAAIILIAVSGFSDEDIREDISKEYGFNVHVNLGLQIPDEPISTDYGSVVVPGAGLSFRSGRIAATFDYLGYNSNSFTPITNTNANMEINHFLFGIEYRFRDLFFSPSIGTGLIYSSLKEDVGDFGLFEDSNTGIFISGSISKRIGEFESFLKIYYSSVLIEEINIGGFFIVLQLGYNL
jgi:hypothetical protein